MPKLVKEIAAGQQFQRSSASGRGLADSQTRVFRILLDHPGEVIYPEEQCDISIGDAHPTNKNIFCVSWDAKFDGDSRTVVIATFNYQATPTSAEDGGGADGGSGGDGGSYSPNIRPANWSVTTSLVEAPASTWWLANSDGSISGDAVPATNPVGDLYDGVSRMDAVSTITIEQFEPEDPTRYSEYVGSVNKDVQKFGSLNCKPGTLMFRGVQARPTVEAWGRQIYRGWMVTYEFAYRANRVGGLSAHEGDQQYEADLGWDIAVPQTGFNIINKTAALGGGVHEIGSLALNHGGDGKIANWPDDPDLVDGTDGKKVRGMVLVHAYSEGGGASQLPAAQPIPLNNDGTPRAHTATPPVRVKRYRTNKTIEYATVFKDIRLTQ